MKKKLVLFDFDGTITSRDTLVEFLIFFKGPLRFFAGMLVLSPVLLAYLLRMIPNWKGKQWCLRYFFGGTSISEFNKSCLTFSHTKLPKLIRSGARKAIQRYKDEGAVIAVVSASAENWVGPWCTENGVHCIATQFEVKYGKVTGKFCGLNCYGPEKVKRIEKQFALSDFDEIVAYGDSSGDREMFGIADQFYYKPFRDKEPAPRQTRSGSFAREI